ncbi:MAG: 50S ribosomal protein L24 [Gammaproteobacteria bacterium]|nr:50S ribosomal protein L24 [Gammaproteobacteria bacterium]
MRKIKKGDEVIVTAGKDKGRRGNVLKVMPEEDRVVVENINMAKKHVRPNPNAGVQGGIMEKEMPINISNVMLYNPKAKKGDRVGIREENGKKVRFFKSTGDVVDI